VVQRVRGKTSWDTGMEEEQDEGNVEADSADNVYGDDDEQQPYTQGDDDQQQSHLNRNAELHNRHDNTAFDSHHCKQEAGTLNRNAELHSVHNKESARIHMNLMSANHHGNAT
jgi:hypothetical protein